MNDTAADPRDFVRMLATARLEVRSAAALPIRTDGKVTHGLMLYATEAGVFTPDIVQTLRAMSADVSFAIDAYNTRRQLFESRNLFEAIIDASDNPIFASDLEGRTLFLNKASALTVGAAKGDAIGRRLADYLPQDLAAAYDRNTATVLHTGLPLVFEEQAQGSAMVFLYDPLSAARHQWRNLRHRRCVHRHHGIEAGADGARRCEHSASSARWRNGHARWPQPGTVPRRPTAPSPCS